MKVGTFRTAAPTVAGLRGAVLPMWVAPKAWLQEGWAMASDLVVILAGYLLGSIPFAYLITKAFTGKDIRREGEGNVGSRNVLHTAGRVAGLLVLLLDTGKGAAAYWVARVYGSGDITLYLTGFAMMVGHGFPVWLHWHGGKGLAAAIGFLMQMWPYSVLGAALVFLLVSRLFTGFDFCFGVAAGAFALLTLKEGTSVEGMAFVVSLLGLAGVKRLIDLPREREIRAQTGWSDEPVRLRWLR